MYPKGFSVDRVQLGYTINYNGIELYYFGFFDDICSYNLDETIFNWLNNLFYQKDAFGFKLYIMLKYSSEFIKSLKILENYVRKIRDKRFRILS